MQIKDYFNKINNYLKRISNYLKQNKLKINILLVISIILIGLIIINVDESSLNSLFINYEDSLVINEVNTHKEDKKEDTTITTSDNNNQTVEKNKATFVNNVANLNNWTFPVAGNYAITTYYSYSHKAIDIYSYNGYGANILAANNGTVITVDNSCTRGDASCNGRRGNYIVINHNAGNYYTVYMHLAQTKVNVGDTVSAGQVIGSMGNTGYVIPAPTYSNPYGGTHLHFCLFKGEPYRGGYAINPYTVY